MKDFVIKLQLELRDRGETEETIAQPISTVHGVHTACVRVCVRIVPDGLDGD